MSDHEQEAILAAVLRSAVDAIIIIDEAGKIEAVNPATERMFGFSLDEMLGQNVKMLMPSPYREQHDGYLRHYHETGEKRIIGIGREVQGRRKDGSSFPLHLAVSEVDTGSRKLFAGVIRDISDQKAIQSQLRHFNATLDERLRQQADELHQAHSALIKKEKFAALGQISGGIAHEIRNPLNVIKTSCYYLLNANSPSEEKWREHLKRIDGQICLIDNVVTALLDLARLPEPILVPCDMVALLEEILVNKPPQEGITVEFDFPEGLPTALVDEMQLSIVFSNLIRNACDAMRSEGKLTLSGRTEGARVVISVQDTGTGMSPEVLARIEEPFFSTKARGMGLGLAITKAIIDKNHGTIDVETRLGIGTKFSVSLLGHLPSQRDS
jgi:two-component system sensor kinase FixL